MMKKYVDEKICNDKSLIKKMWCKQWWKIIVKKTICEEKIVMWKKEKKIKDSFLGG